VLPAPRVPDGLTVMPFFEKHSQTRKAPRITYRITAKTLRPDGTARIGLCPRLPGLRTPGAELPLWTHRYNWHRPYGILNSRPPISRLALSEDNLLRLHS
jgi:transposase InsO family protein